MGSHRSGDLSLKELIERWRRLASSWKAEEAMSVDEDLKSRMVLARKAYFQCARELEAWETQRRAEAIHLERVRSA